MFRILPHGAIGQPLLSPLFLYYYGCYMKRIPFFPQENDYYCGPAIIQMVLAAHGKTITQLQAARRAKTNRHVGTAPRMLIQTLEKEGLRVQVKEKNTLAGVKKAIEQGAIVIVLFIEPVAEWDHYAIVREIKGDMVILLDPDARGGRTTMLAKEFLRRWKDRDVAQTHRWAAFVEEPRKNIIER